MINRFVTAQGILRSERNVVLFMINIGTISLSVCHIPSVHFPIRFGWKVMTKPGIPNVVGGAPASGCAQGMTFSFEASPNK